MVQTSPELTPEMREISMSQSESVWNALRLALSTYMDRQDLVRAAEIRDLNAFRGEFDF